MGMFSMAFMVNLSTIFFALIAGIYVWKRQHPGRTYFVGGLCLVVLSGLFAVPAAEQYVDSFSTAITLSNIVGFIHGMGLLVCALAFTRTKESN